MQRRVVTILMILSILPACGEKKAVTPIAPPVAEVKKIEPEAVKRDDKYDRLMFMAIENYTSSTPETIGALIGKGADVNARDENGNTPLILATEQGYLELVKVLLAAGADFDLQNKQGRTAAYIASKMGREEISLMIREKKMKQYDLIFNVP